MSGEITPFPNHRLNGPHADKLVAQVLGVPTTEAEMQQRLRNEPPMFAAFKYGQSHAFAQVKPALDEGLKQAAGWKAEIIKTTLLARQVEGLKGQIEILEREKAILQSALAAASHHGN